MRINGPATLATGVTAQYTAVADYTDGTTKDVTNDVAWTIVRAGPANISNVLQVSGHGTVLALTAGEAFVEAAPPPNSLIVDNPFIIVLSLDPGTFRISGLITFAGEPAVAATAEIISGTGTGHQMTIATAGSDAGRYALYGAAGGVDVRVTADGFDSQVHHLDVAEQVTDNFALTLSGSSVDLSGAWTATFTASPSCQAKLPATAVDRQFSVDITQASTVAHLAFTSSAMALSVCCVQRAPLTVDGRIFGQTLTFPLDYDSGDGPEVYPHLLELLSPTQLLGRYGQVTAAVAGSQVTGTFDGDVVFSSGTSSTGPPPPTVDSACHSTDGPVVLRRR